MIDSNVEMANRKSKILVVDDNPQNLYLLQVLLSGYGYEVATAGNGAEALDKARRDPPDMVIADILMPVMDGFTLCRQWKKDEALKAVPFVFYTATYTDPRDEELALSLGAARFIRKPVEPDAFVGKLREVIREAEEGRLVAPREPVEEEPVYLKEYSERLVKKLEDKMVQLERAKRRLTVLYEASTGLASLRPPDELVPHTLRTVVEAMGFSNGSYFAYDEERQEFHLQEAVGFPAELVDTFRQKLVLGLGEERGLVGLVGQTRQPLVVADTRADPRWITLNGTIRSALFVPVIHKGRLLGVANFLSTEVGDFDEEDVRNLMTLANNLSIAIENAELLESLRQSEARFRRLAENAQDLIYRYRFTPTRGFEYVSPAATTITGYTPEEHYADPDLGFKLVHPESRPLLEALTRGEIPAGTPVTLRWVRKDGTAIWTEQRNAPIYDETGNLVAIEGIARDVTERVRAEEEIGRLATKLKAIARPARQMSALLDLDKLVQQVVQSLQEVTGCYNANLFLREGDDLTLAAGQGGYEDGRPPLGYRLRLGQGIIGHVAQTGQPVLVPDVSQDPHYVAWEGLPHTHSELAVPVKHGDKVLGVMDMQATEIDAFDTTDLEALGALADQLAVALQNARLFQSEQKRAQQLAIINDLGRALAATLDLRTVYRTAYQYVQRLVDCPNFSISLFNPEQRVITATFVISDDVELDLAQFPPLSYKPQARTGRSKAIASAQAVVVYNLHRATQKSDDLYRIGSGQEPLSALYVPMIVEGQVIGLLEVQSYQDQAYRREYIELLGPVANQIGLAIQNARLFERTRRRTEELSVLHQAALVAVSASDLDTLLEQVVETVGTIIYPDNFGFLLLDPQTQTLHPHPSYRGVSPQDLDTVVPVGQGITGQVAQTGEPLLVPDVRQAEGYLQIVPETRSELCVPLKADGRILGVINAESRRLHAFSEDDLRLLSTLAGQLTTAIERVRLFGETRRRLEYLQALRNVDMTITASLDLRVTLDILLNQVITQLRVDAADVLLFNRHMQTLEYAAGRGFRTAALRHTRLRLGEGHAGRAALERRIVSIADLRQARDAFERAKLLDSENFVSYFGAPLVAKGQIKGVLEIFCRAPLPPLPSAGGGREGGEWLSFLEALATQAAIAIDNAELFENLQRSNMELALAYDTTLEGWARALELRDYETEGHSRRVTDMTLAIARAMGISEAALAHVRRGALLHDIGKMGIPDSILLKPDKLTDEEWEIMRKHPVYAYELLSPIRHLRPVLDIPYCHHEKWDGTGYPQGLKGEQIPLAARIFAVVDVWDALLSERPYRPAWSQEKALEHIQEQAGKHFDPQVVEVFTKHL